MASVWKRGQIYWCDFRWNGIRYRWPLKTTKRKEAERIMGDIVGQMVRGTFNLGQYEKKQISFGQFREEYLQYAEANKSHNTLELERIYLSEIVGYFGANTNLRAIDARVVDQWRSHFLKRETRSAGRMASDLGPASAIAKKHHRVSPATYNIVLRIMRAAFNLALKWGYVESNPFLGAEKAQVDERRLFLTEDEIARLFRRMEQDITQSRNPGAIMSLKRLRVLAEFVLETGLRRNEALNLRSGDMDANYIYVSKTKGRRDRTIPLSDRARDLIGMTGERLFGGMNGHDVTENLSHYFRAVGLCGFKPVHSFRHTFACRLVREGVDIYTISRLLGHRDLKTTLIYSKLDMRVLSNAIGKLRPVSGAGTIWAQLKSENKNGQ